MATDFIMPRLPDQQTSFFQRPSHHSPIYPQQPSALQSDYYSHQQTSPFSTPNSGSPTSPSAPKAYHQRQLRPLYIPAVLRPTEHPSKAPVKVLKPESLSSVDTDKGVRSSNSFISLSGLSALSRLSRRSTGDSGKCVDIDWDLNLFPKVTSPPTRAHWKPDSQSAICDEPTCKRYFSYFTRRHHCRRCGNLFCDSHSAFDVPLDEGANFNPRGTTSRSCAHCFTEFQAWRSRTNSQDSTRSCNLQQGTTPASSNTAPASPVGGSSPTSINGADAPTPKQEVAMSVPRDWTWSTF